MSENKSQYVLVPAVGLEGLQANPQQLRLFQSLHKIASSASQLQSTVTESGTAPIKVVDSIGENKAKLIECAPEDLPASRAGHPSTRVLPVVYFQRAVIRYELAIPTRASAVRAAARASAGGITIVSSTDGKPVANAMVVAFSDFATRGNARNHRVELSPAAGIMALYERVRYIIAKFAQRSSSKEGTWQIQHLTMSASIPWWSCARCPAG